MEFRIDKIKKAIDSGANTSLVQMVPQIGHNAPIEQIYLSPDADYFLTVQQKGMSACLWEVSSGKMIREYEFCNLEHENAHPILCATFGPEGNILALGGKGKILVYDSRSKDKKEIRISTLSSSGKKPATASSLLLSGNEKYLFYPRDSGLCVANIQEDKHVHIEAADIDKPFAIKVIDISKDGNVMVGVAEHNGNWKGYIWLKDWQKGTIKIEVEVPFQSNRKANKDIDMMKIHVSPDGAHVLIWFRNKTTREYKILLYTIDQEKQEASREREWVNELNNVWDTDSLEDEALTDLYLEEPHKACHFAFFSEDGSYVLLGIEGSMYHYDLESKNLSEINNGYQYSRANPPVFFTKDFTYYFIIDNSIPKNPCVRMLRASDGILVRKFHGLKVLDKPQEQFAQALSQIKKDESKAFRDHIENTYSINSNFGYKVLENGNRDISLNFIPFLSEDGSSKPNYLLYNPKTNQYLCNKSQLPKIITFVVNNKAYDFEEFDSFYNKPHEVLKLLEKEFSNELIRVYKEAFSRRQKDLKINSSDKHLLKDGGPKITLLTPIPLEIEKESESVFELMIQIEDDKQFKLENLDVRVNGVPIYGIKGLSLKGRYTHQTKVKIPLELSKGQNKIQISASNQKGDKSLVEKFEINFKTKNPDLHLYAIGVSEYVHSALNLEYAAKDAKELVEKYKDRARDQSKHFGQLKVRSLLNEKASKEKLLSIKADLLHNSSIDDYVILYYAGHGVRDENLNLYLATHDMDFNNPAEKGLAFTELEGLLDGIPSRNKLLIMDACFTGELDRERFVSNRIDIESISFGVELADATAEETPVFIVFGKELEDKDPIGTGRGPDPFNLMKSTFADLRPNTGTTVLASAAGDQFALEQDSIANGVFTEAMLALMTTGPNQGSLKVSELYDKVKSKVEMDTEKRQSPTLRTENAENDFRIW